MTQNDLNKLASKFEELEKNKSNIQLFVRIESNAESKNYVRASDFIFI